MADFNRKNVWNRKKTYPRLIALGINTIGDLAKTEDERVKSLLGNTYLYHKSHALGEGDDIVQPYENDPKSISSARTFDHDTTDYEELKTLSSDVQNRFLNN